MLELLDPLVRKAQRVTRGLLALPVRRDPRVIQGLLDRRDPKVIPELRDPRVIPGPQNGRAWRKGREQI